MKRNNIKSAKGFTLVEMLGVLAIIAILVSIVSVGVMTAIKSARITGTIANLKNYETALAAHVTFNEGNGFVPLTKGMPTGQVGDLGGEQYAHLGQVLIASGALDSLPTWRIGREDRNSAQVIDGKWDIDSNKFSKGTGTPGTNMISWTNRHRAEAVKAGPWATDGAVIVETVGSEEVSFSVGKEIPEGSTVAYVKLVNVSVADAIKLSESLNRNFNTANTTTPEQILGRFVFGTDETGGEVASGVAPACYYYLGYY